MKQKSTLMLAVAALIVGLIAGGVWMLGGVGQGDEVVVAIGAYLDPQGFEMIIARGSYLDPLGFVSAPVTTATVVSGGSTLAA